MNTQMSKILMEGQTIHVHGQGQGRGRGSVSDVRGRAWCESRAASDTGRPAVIHTRALEEEKLGSGRI